MFRSRNQGIRRGNSTGRSPQKGRANCLSGRGLFRRHRDSETSGQRVPIRRCRCVCGWTYRGALYPILSGKLHEAAARHSRNRDEVPVRKTATLPLMILFAAIALTGCPRHEQKKEAAPVTQTIAPAAARPDTAGTTDAMTQTVE